MIDAAEQIGNTSPTALASLKYANARLPFVYDRARAALAKCFRIDECKDWADKALALSSYARQSQDDSLRKMADRIKARAIRRCGELLRQIEPARGANQNIHTADDTKVTRSSAAAEAGMSKRQKDTALRVATVPDESFEAQVESDKPPTVTQLAEQGRQVKPKPAIVPLVDLEGIPPHVFMSATEAGGHLRALADFARAHDPTEVASGFKAHECPAVRANVAVIDAWLDRFITTLEE